MLEQLYHHQYLPFLAWVLRNKGQEADAQDAFHDAFCAVEAQLRRSDHEIANPGNYLHWTSKTCYFALCRQRGRFIPTDFQDVSNKDAEQDEAPSTMGESASDLSSISTEEEISPNGAALKEVDSIRYDPNNWGIVRECLPDLSVRRQFILTLYFTLLTAAEIKGKKAQPGELVVTVAQACRKAFGTKDTSGSINVDKSRALDDLREALYRRYPDQVRFLKSKHDQHKTQLKKNRPPNKK